MCVRAIGLGVSNKEIISPRTLRALGLVDLVVFRLKRGKPNSYSIGNQYGIISNMILDVQIGNDMNNNIRIDINLDIGITPPPPIPCSPPAPSADCPCMGWGGSVW